LSIRFPLAVSYMRRHVLSLNPKLSSAVWAVLYWLAVSIVREHAVWSEFHVIFLQNENNSSLKELSLCFNIADLFEYFHFSNEKAVIIHQIPFCRTYPWKKLIKKTTLISVKYCSALAWQPNLHSRGWSKKRKRKSIEIVPYFEAEPNYKKNKNKKYSYDIILNAISLLFAVPPFISLLS